MFDASLSLFDADGCLLEWNEGFALEFSDAGAMLARGLPYQAIWAKCLLPERALDLGDGAGVEAYSDIAYINNRRPVVVQYHRSMEGNLFRMALIYEEGGAAFPNLSRQDVDLLQTGALRMAAAILAHRNKAEQDIRHLAHTDSLTGIANRLHFMEAAARVLADMKSHALGETAVLMMADLDHFKRINDSYGHLAGDVVLKGFAEMLRHAGARHGDLEGRLGGEEFALLLPNASIEAGVAIAQSLCEKMRGEKFEFDGELAMVTVSFGVTEMNAADSTPDDVVKRVDDAMYAAKNAGRDRVSIL